MVTNYEDVLIRTLQGLEDDLEELRALLMRQLDGFEGTLKKLTQELPVWLQLPQSKITNTIKFPNMQVDFVTGFDFGDTAIFHFKNSI